MTLKKLCCFLPLLMILAMPSRAQLPALLEQKLQDTLNYMQQHFQTMGLSAAVSVRGQGLWKGTAGHSEPGVALGTDMLIGIGSNTKTFISALVLQQEEAGHLSLDDTIGTWIQGYPDISGAITIKQLLNHTSGLFNYTESGALWDSLLNNPTRLWTKEEILQYFTGAPVFSPGNGWEYCNTNYIIAGIILEAVSGQPAADLIRNNILSPLQMDHTFFPPDEVPGYPLAGFWTEGGQYVLPIESYSIPGTAGALVATPEDVVHFWEGLFSGAIISKSTLNQKMLQMAVTSADNKYGYGLGIFKDNYFDNTGYSHGGTWLGQINSNFIDTVRGITICVLSNQDSLSNPYTEAVVAALYKVFLETTPILEPEQEAFQALFYPNPARDMLYLQNTQYTGERLVTVRGLDGRLWLQRRYAPGMPVALETAAFPSGIYIAEVSDSRGKRKVQKLSILH